MGRSPKQVNSAQASQANAAANQSEQASAALTQQNTKQAQQNYNYLFGENGPGGGGGSLSPFLDPGKVTNGSGAPTGTYGTIYSNAVQQGARDYANARGSLAQQWANNGFAGGMPNGFQADQERKLASSAADANGQNFTNLATAAHQEDLNNFWNATNVAAGQGATSTGAAVNAAANEGSTATGIYSTAGKQAAPSSLPGAILGGIGTAAGAALGPGGIATNAAACPARGSMVRTKRGHVAVEDLGAGDYLLQSDGHFRSLPEDPHMVLAECVDIETQRGRHTRVSEGHAFSTNGGGYVDAIESRNAELRAHHEKDLVTSVAKAGRCEVLVMPKFGNNTYLCDDLWSLT